MAHKQQYGFYLVEKKNKWRNLNFHLGLNLFTLPEAWCPTSGESWQTLPPLPTDSRETGREKCATEWKSQHSQPSQIAIESIYSTLVKTPNQALIMREGERNRERECVCVQYLQANTKRDSTLVFIYPLQVELAISSGPCVLDAVLVSLWMTCHGVGVRGFHMPEDWGKKQ